MPDFSGDFHDGVAGDATTATVDDYSTLLVEEADRIQLVTSPLRRGNFSARIECREDDVDDNGLSDRTEYASTNFKWVTGNEFWVATSIYLPTDWTAPTGWLVAHQFFSTDSAVAGVAGNGGGSPPIAVEIEDDEFRLTVRGGVKADAAATPPHVAIHDLIPAAPGRWHDILLHVLLSTTESGLVEGWAKHPNESFTVSPQASEAGINVFTIGGTNYAIYPETGIYRQTNPTTQVLYTAGMRVRNTRTHAEAFFDAPGEYVDEVTADSPGHHWRLGEASGTLVDGPGSNDGTSANSPTYGVTGLVGDSNKAMDFTPANSHVTMGDISYAEGAAVTVEAVCKPGTINTVVLAYAEAASGANNPQFYLYQTSTAWRAKYVDASAATTFDLSSGSGVIAAGHIYHVALTMVRNDTARLYVNGSLLASTASVAVADPSGAFNTSAIAALPRLAPAFLGGNMVVDEVAVYPVALDPGRIQVHADAVFQTETILPFRFTRLPLIPTIPTLA